MANKHKQQVSKKADKQKTGGSRIPFPFLLLSIIVLLVYAPSFKNGYTELDDTIFIQDFSNYNDDISNLGESFNRGVFSDSGDTYYRPLLLDSFVLNYQLSESDIGSYHVINIFLHLMAVLLLFMLLKKLGIEIMPAFLLTVLFAVHPVLSQAVAWVPGRNDTMLAVFSFLFMINAVQFSEKGKWYFLIIQFVSLLAAFFTKETALFVAPAFFCMWIFMKKVDWKQTRNLILYGTWLLSALIWFVMRSRATLVNETLQAGDMFGQFIHRMPLLLQYIGKMLLPINLSVFPMMNDTAYLPGILAVLILVSMIWFAKNKNKRMIIAGVAWFVLLLFPVLILPAKLNDQDFEHRLYVPILGFIILLSQTVLFKNLNQRTTVLVCLLIVVVFSIININHQKKFSDPLTFWTAAVESTPHSAYATMMLAARMTEKDRVQGDELMMKAYQLNPKEKYINFYMGKLYIDRDSIKLAEKYFMDELEISSYYETYFHLSRVEFEKGNFEQSTSYMEKFLSLDPTDEQGINNYTLLLLQTGQKEKAQKFLNEKRKEGIVIPNGLMEQVK